MARLKLTADMKYENLKGVSKKDLLQFAMNWGEFAGTSSERVESWSKLPIAALVEHVWVEIVQPGKKRLTADKRAAARRLRVDVRIHCWTADLMVVAAQLRTAEATFLHVDEDKAMATGLIPVDQAARLLDWAAGLKRKGMSIQFVF